MNRGAENNAAAWIVRGVCLLGLCAAAVSALDLSAHGLRYFLTSDFLTPHFFCLDILTGHYPLSGWTLSASPYFVPDHVLLCGLMTAFGRAGQAYGLYTLVFYPLLFVLAGLCIRTAVGQTGPAWLAAMLFGNGLLALRFLPGHDEYLWWLGAPCCHGGVLLLGFAYLWTLGTGLRRDRVGWLPAPLFGLGLLALGSDSLFLFQVLLPASVALWLNRRRHPAFAVWLRWQGGCAVASLLVAQLFKPICFWAGCFYFSRIIRRAPTPANEFEALSQFVADVPPLLHNGWGFALLVLAAAALLWHRWRRPDQPDDATTGNDPGVLDFYRVFCAASLIIIFPLPVLICAWRSASNVRYLFNGLVFPGFLLAMAAAASGRMQAARRGWWLAGSAVVFLLCLGRAAHDLRDEPLRFPYPADVAALDTLLQSRGAKYGLAEYWQAKYPTALSHAGAELRQVRASGEPFFWDNNAFGYYARDAAGNFAWPAYQYIIVNQLDEGALLKAYGEPQSKETAGRFRVWFYAEDGQRKIRAALEPAVRDKLGPARLPLLDTSARR